MCDILSWVQVADRLALKYSNVIVIDPRYHKWEDTDEKDDHRHASSERRSYYGRHT